MKAWIAALDAGTYTRPQMLDNFVTSQEFQNRVTVLLGQGCVAP